MLCFQRPETALVGQAVEKLLHLLEEAFRVRMRAFLAGLAGSMCPSQEKLMVGLNCHVLTRGIACVRQ